jgi:hypothetical protein
LHRIKLTAFERRLSDLQLSIVGTLRTVAAADLVFVHGLGGDGQTSWQIDGDASTFWPLWIYEEVIYANVWSLSYPAGKIDWGSGAGMLLPDRAKTILDLMCSNGIGKRPLVFVTHSLGGLLVKQILRSAWELQIDSWTQLARNTRGVIFLATPHNGSGLAAFAKAISIFSGVTTQIAYNDPHLRELNEWFQQNANSKGLSVKTYFETQKTDGFLVVDAASANPGIEGCVPVAFDGDHRQICKPNTKLNPIYKGCCHFVDDCLTAETGNLTSALTELDDLEGSAERAVAEQYAFFTTSVDEDRLDLTQKLNLGNRTAEIPRALRLKEQFAKTFARNQLQTSSTRHYLNVLAEVESRFNGHVYPEIVAGASHHVVADLIRTKITDPVLERYSGEHLIDAVVVDRMIYYLTGLCHIRWSA